MTPLSLVDRVGLYHAAFPDYPRLFVDRGWIVGTWMIGNQYASDTTLYGAYPPTYLARVFSMFPDRRRTIHVCSGSLPPYANQVTLDIRVEGVVRPMIRGDAARLPFAPGAFDLALVDPPYSTPDAKHYGTGMPSRAAIMRSLATVVEPGGYVVWLDTVRPQFRKVEWHECAFIGLARSTNNRVRGVFMYRRRDASSTSDQASSRSNLRGKRSNKKVLPL